MPRRELKVFKTTLMRDTGEYERSRDALNEALYKGQDIDCPLCKDKEVNIRRKNGVLVRLPRAPYAYGHIMLMPEAHKANMRDLSKEEFKQLVLQMGEIAKGMKAQGFPLAFGSNHGAIAGQTIGHLHVHGMPLEWQELSAKEISKKGGVARSRGGGIYFDPLALQIMHSMKFKLWQSDNRILGKAIVPEEKGKGIIVRFKSFDELSRNHAAIQELFTIAEKTFRNLEERPDRAARIPTIYKKNAETRRKKDSNLLSTQLLSHYTQAKDNFGAQWMVREDENGGVEFHFLPRATAIILPRATQKGTMGKVEKVPFVRGGALEDRVESVLGKKISSRELPEHLGELRFSALQHFMGAHLERGEVSPGKAKQLDEQRVKALFKVLFKTEKL